MPKTDIPFTLRIPVGLHGQLRERALRERRSLNAIIVWLLERATENSAEVAWVANPPEEIE